MGIVNNLPPQLSASSCSIQGGSIINQTSLGFTVFSEGPPWVGLFEYHERQLLYLKRIVFGGEPSEQVVYKQLKGCWYSINFQAPVETMRSKASHWSPRRVQYETHRAQDIGLSLTKSQPTVKQQWEERMQRKAERRKANKEEQKEAFHLRQMRKKTRYKGR